MGSRQSRVESGVESAEAHADDIRSAAEASRSGDAVVLPGDLASQPVAQQSMRSPRDEFVTVRERNVTAPPPSTPEVGRLRELPDFPPFSARKALSSVKCEEDIESKRALLAEIRSHLVSMYEEVVERQTPVFCNLHHAEQMCQKQMPDVRRRAREMNELRSAYPEVCSLLVALRDTHHRVQRTIIQLESLRNMLPEDDRPPALVRSDLLRTDDW